MSLSRTLEIAVCNWLRGTQLPTPPTSLTFALSTTPILDDGSQFNEPAGSGYSRQPITLSAPVHTEGVGAVVRNANALVFGPSTGPWGTIVAGAVLDQAGNILFKGEFAAPRAVPVGDGPAFGIGTVEFRVR